MKAIAKWLSAHGTFKTHARPIARDALAQKGLAISDLEQDQTEQDLFFDQSIMQPTHVRERARG